ncbi:uncharacterized protein MELLADRAFT_104601 [Melampsora larici-populina 98AG31]|uniref:Uncharacterized protein n=1 Tax=Melampsora larici-populina (strain 98AG31 / pathotype 3-4-7) TaxID=747676 RepID=F4RF93_MELLP|nr:uncharacterized protein MELLADRAFT_104601 [Melampsora larici-populina 98AG31]EGG08772.1 hypothetical protein MELLADRAFT_104601 [Melampsora larici-populina 98AG31]
MASAIVIHPIQAQFTGRIGNEIRNLRQNDSGFTTFSAKISIPGATKNAAAIVDVELTTLLKYNIDMNVGDLYTISCKFIASNTPRNDTLHFCKDSCVKLLSAEESGSTFDNNAMGRISMVALGTVVAKEILPNPENESEVSVVLTVKAVDIDPVSRSPVTWISRHYVGTVSGTTTLDQDCAIGTEVELAGMVIGYDPATFTWILKAYSMTVFGATIPTGVPAWKQTATETATIQHTSVSHWENQYITGQYVDASSVTPHANRSLEGTKLSISMG